LLQYSKTYYFPDIRIQVSKGDIRDSGKLFNLQSQNKNIHQEEEQTQMKKIVYIGTALLAILLICAAPVSAISFSNLVGSGSTFNGNTGSLVTSIGSLSTDQPKIDYKVALNGLNNVPATGSISAFSRGNLMEGNNNGGLASQLIFSQRSSATGSISQFAFSFHYNSKLTA
jgi:hypothetical protein